MAHANTATERKYREEIVERMNEVNSGWVIEKERFDELFWSSIDL